MVSMEVVCFLSGGAEPLEVNDSMHGGLVAFVAEVKSAGAVLCSVCRDEV